MRVGVPKEIKSHEYRVGLTPDNIANLTRAGHQCAVQTNAGAAIGFSDADYRQAGASILDSAAAVYEFAELLVKVKEPQSGEVKLLKPHQLLFCFLHLAANKTLTEQLCASGATCIAFETVTDAQGRLPLLAPMSEIAGRMSVQAGAHHLENPQGGAGVLLGGVPGVAPGRVLIIGGGVVGTQAARMAVGLGATVTILDQSIARLRELDQLFLGRVTTLMASPMQIERSAQEADLIIGAVLVSGAAAPKLISEALVARLKPGTVLVDVAIDQGGCFATSRPTTHDNPTYLVNGVVHYCVANIPGAVARTATQALTNATFPFVQLLAQGGLISLRDNPFLQQGVNIMAGQVVYLAVAESLGLPLAKLALS